MCIGYAGETKIDLRGIVPTPLNLYDSNDQAWGLSVAPYVYGGGGPRADIAS